MSMWQWHQLDHMHIISILQGLTDNHADTSILNFYKPGASPDAQPTVSEHCPSSKNTTQTRTVTPWHFGTV